MNSIRFIAIASLSISAAAISRGQVSTFPVPPALAPAPESTTSVNTQATPAASNSGAANSNSSQPDNGTKSSIPITAATLTSMAALDDKNQLEPGDSVSFRVIEDRDQPVSRVVTDTGEVDFPYIGRVKVEGKTCHEVAIEVKKLLEVDYYKRATVIIGLDLIVGQDDKLKAKDMAWVVGEVRQVGPVELVKVQPMTVSQIILRAGGFGDFADQRKVKVIHRAPGESTEKAPDLNNTKDAQVIDVKSIFDGKSGTDPIVKPGDYIIVPKRFFNY